MHSLLLVGVSEPVRRARRWARHLLVTWQLPVDIREDVTLALNELIANAVLHAPPVLRVDVVRRPQDILVEVFDSTRTLPQIRLASPHDESGRGLRLVSRVAHDWGSRQLTTADGAPAGKVVWCAISTPTPSKTLSSPKSLSPPK